MEDLNIILDFDSTFIQVEGLEELASLSLKQHPDREKLLADLHQKTILGMEGKAPYSQVLKERVDVICANRKHVEKLSGQLSLKVTPSILRNKKFFKNYSDKIYIFSGGFIEFIWPIVEPFGIRRDHVFANSFTFDYAGNIVGFDEKNPLSTEGGKAKLLDQLNLNGNTVIIGDGYTDYEATLSGSGRKFFAFTENVYRKPVVEKADRELKNFDDFFKAYPLSDEIASSTKRMKALLLENIHPISQHSFISEGFDVETISTALSEEELLKIIPEVSVLGIRSKTVISEKVLDKAVNLQAIGSFCIGTDVVDLKACLKRGIAVFNAPYSNTRSVVELAIGEIIILLRKIFEKSGKLHKGTWDKGAGGSVEVRGKRLGIIGYGKIGSQLSTLAEALGMQVYFYDCADKLPLGNAIKCDSLEEVLRKVDVLSIHVDGRKENHGLIGKKEFECMRDGAIFLNLSRGNVVDLDELAAHLKNGKLRGAAVDVYPEEPKGPGEEFSSKLQGLPNVILTPHIGGSTQEAQENIGGFVTSSILSYLHNGSSRASVNFPEVRLPSMKHTHRLIHIHENVSGMLAQVSSILAAHEINIEGQYLKTNEKVGYVIIDTNSTLSPSLLDELRNIPHTIRVRSLY
ncbi:MAG: D-3-phosphoglycerate dehydrogenase [Chlamydiales bacterium]|jgi:D-3-phosphoglycerate dehydrogenase